MGTIRYTIEHNQPDTIIVTWAALTKTAGVLDVGQRLVLPGYDNRSVEVYGTFGAAGKVAIYGSNNTDLTATGRLLTDQSDNNLEFTTAKLEQILQIAYQMWPEVTVGEDAVTTLTVKMTCKRIPPGR